MQQLGGEESLIPRPRGTLPRKCAMGLAAVTTAAVFLSKPESTWRLVATAILILTLGPLLHGVFLFAEEWLFHANTRYRGRQVLGDLLPACVDVRTLAAVLFGLAGAQLEQSQSSLVVLVCALYPLFKTLGVLGPSRVEVSEICEGGKMNVAHGLAWSFYQGYLKLVLPRLEDSIAEFRATHPAGLFLNSGSRRLLILVPINTNICHKLEDDDTHISFFDNLPNVEMNTAGVRGRVYKHSVYCVLDENKQPHECVVEYATPLLTLYRMSQESSAGFGERDRREQVLLFYRTLQDILDCSLECRNRYSLILLNDEHEDDPHFLSKVILRRLQQQEKEEVYMPPPPQPTADWHPAQPMSTEPSLMISHDMPRTLREPVENEFR